MKISTSIETNDFKALEAVVNNAKPVLTWWASRRIVVDGYEGSVSIDALAARVIALVKEKGFEYTPEERLIGKRMAEKISLIYNHSDRQVKGSAGITKLFWLIYLCYRCIPFSVSRYITSVTRWKWENFSSTISSTEDSRGNSYYHSVFEYYTPRQYAQTFQREAPAERDVFKFWEADLIHESKGGQLPRQAPSSHSTFHTGTRIRELEDARVDWGELPLHS